MKNIDKLAWLCIQDQHVLLARSKGKDTFYIPGGKREVGENDQQALLREIQEELSIQLKPSTIQFAESFTAQAHDKSAGTLVTMTCYFSEFTGEIKPAAEIEEIRWVNSVDNIKCSIVTLKIIHWLNSRDLIK